MGEKLKLCPVCGGLAYDNLVYDTYCTNPQCVIYSISMKRSRWNNRPTEDALRIQVEELEKKLKAFNTVGQKLNDKFFDCNGHFYWKFDSIEFYDEAKELRDLLAEKEKK